MLGLVLVLLVLVFYLCNTDGFNDFEGFETIQSKIQDRVNPLAARQNPLRNPAAQIGISEADGIRLTAMTQVALNSPIATADGAGSYKQETAPGQISPRIDNENSFLGLVKMCKDKGVSKNPFSDSAFAENCGMCITSGRLATGESFNTPTGVLVYKADKNEANNAKLSNGYSFARALPSLNGATCVGTSKNDDALPVLAINEADYYAFRMRKECREGHKIGQECGRCVSDQQSTWVPPSGGKQPLTLYLWGAGNATVSLGNGFNRGSIKLSNTASLVAIGRVEEGIQLQIDVLKGDSVDGPHVYGAIISATANRGIYKLPIEKFMEFDAVSRSPPRRNGIKYFDDAKVFCNKLMPQANRQRMTIQGPIPITLVEPDQLAAFDCASSPLVQSQRSAEFLIDDVCLNPRGQGPGTYSDACLKQTVLQAGCSTNGNWYKDTESMPKNFKLGDWLNDMKNKLATLIDTDPIVSMGCKGIDISTPCDPFLTGGIPDQQCLNYLYFNQSEKNKRVGRAYKYADTQYTSMNGNMMGFCRDGGSLNPSGPLGPTAVSTLRRIAGGYKGVSGIEAVKMYLSDVFMKAVGSLDLNLEDKDGGRKTSWQQCFGLKVADLPLVKVVKNSINDVIDNRQICLFTDKLPSSFRPSPGTIIARNILMPQDYSLSFTVTPYGISPQWNNIIHVTRSSETNDLYRCPAIWFYPRSLNMHVRVGDETDWNFGVDSDPIPINQRSSFRLVCSGSTVTLTVNSRIYTARQPRQRRQSPWFRARGMNETMNIFSGFPAYQAANCLVEDMCFVPL